MYSIFDAQERRVATIVELCGGWRSLTFSRRLNGKYRDLCSSRERVFLYLQHVLPGFSVKRINYEEEIAKIAGGRLSGDSFAES